MECNVKKTHKCDLCSKAFSQKGDLNKHIRIHTGEKPYKCELCSKAFSQKSVLTNHIRTHTGEKPYKCEICSKAFALKGNLDDHKRIHTGEKPYKCELCLISFTQKSDLTKHIRTHTGEKPYKCEICSTAFSLKGNLDEHKRTHTGEKAYKCEICSKAFAQKGNLSKHMRFHTGEKPYKCELCPKAFIQKSDLTNHIRTHTGEKPHICDICSRAFAHISNLNDHKRTHTGEKPYKCDICSLVFSNEMTQIRHKRIHSGKKAHNISCSTSSEKETLRKQPLSEDASTSIQEVSTQGKSKQNYKGGDLIKIRSLLSQLSDYRMKHKLTPEEVFKDIKQWQVEDGAMANRSMHPLKTEDYTQFLKICNHDVRESTGNISPNLLDSSLWITVQFFLSYVYKEDFSTKSCDNYPASQTPETGMHLEKIDSVNNTYLKTDKVQENSCDLATNGTACHLVITNVSSLQNFSSDSQSTVGGSFETDVEMGTHFEEYQSCVRKSVTEKKMGSHDSSVNDYAEPLFLKSEVILSDEEGSHDLQSQNIEGP